MMIARLRRTIRAAVLAAFDEWQQPRLRKAKLIISDDGHLITLVFPSTVTLRERNNVRRELVDTLVAGGYWHRTPR